jgi:hypothetical protein
MLEDEGAVVTESRCLPRGLFACPHHLVHNSPSESFDLVGLLGVKVSEISIKIEWHLRFHDGI